MKMKICLFGDSVGKGVVFDTERGRYIPCHDSFTKILESKYNIEIDNHCKFGCTVVKGEEVVAQRAEKLSAYDYVILQYGSNDSDFDWKSVAETPAERHDCNTTMSVFRGTYRRIIEFIRKCGGNPVMLNLAPVDSVKYYRWISKTNDGDAIARFLGSATRIEHWNEVYNNAVWNIASSNGVPVLDIRSPILYERDFSDFFCDDGIHPNAKGHKLIANGIFSEVSDLLEQR